MSPGPHCAGCRLPKTRFGRLPRRDHALFRLTPAASAGVCDGPLRLARIRAAKALAGDPCGSLAKKQPSGLPKGGSHVASS
ncbi:hypothetical protein NY78_2175 [Desulfovibrio sp. TomC]|nr:hypothetical protein NY78_2175 [Desulfovibrio sp. TomC]